jgi:RNA polymerase sigma-70 factor (ECF subfamily)
MDNIGLIRKSSVQQQPGQIDFEEEALIRRCRQGDLAAMEGLIVKYQGRIYNVILKICQNHDDALELAQDAFVKALENIGDFKGQSGFYTWLFRIAVNLTLNYCKRRDKIVFQSLDDEQSDRFLQAKARLKMLLEDESSPDPTEIAQNNELCELLNRALAKLEDPQRAVVVLRDIEGMDYARIAETLGIELGTVKSRLNRARNNLREILEEML